MIHYMLYNESNDSEYTHYYAKDFATSLYFLIFNTIPSTLFKTNTSKKNKTKKNIHASTFYLYLPLYFLLLLTVKDYTKRRVSRFLSTFFSLLPTILHSLLSISTLLYTYQYYQITIIKS